MNKCCSKLENHMYFPLTRTPNLYSVWCKICKSDIKIIDRDEHPELFPKECVVDA